MTDCDAVKRKDPLRVSVSLYGVVRDIIKETTLTVSLPGEASVRDLLRRLAETYGERLGERLLDSRGELQKNVRVFFNEELISSAEEKVKEGEGATQEVRVIVLSAAAGG